MKLPRSLDGKAARMRSGNGHKFGFAEGGKRQETDFLTASDNHTILPVATDNMI